MLFIQTRMDNNTVLQENEPGNQLWDLVQFMVKCSWLRLSKAANAKRLNVHVLLTHRVKGLKQKKLNDME